jgi:hypothetical protein
MAREQGLRRQLIGASNFVRMVLVVGVFGLAGPPIGGLIAWAIAWATMGAPALRAPLPFIAGAYAEGLELALYTGLVCAVIALLARSVGWMVPVVSALIVTVSWIAVGVVVSAPPDTMAAVLRTSKVFVPASLLAAVACWALARPLLRGGD